MNDDLHRMLEETLDTLDRRSERLAESHTSKRKHQRHPYRRPIVVCFPEEETGDEPGKRTIIRATARNLSRSGLAFLYHELIKREELIVALRSPEETFLCLRAKVVRCKQVNQGVWEYGIRFLRKENPSAP